MVLSQGLGRRSGEFVAKPSLPVRLVLLVAGTSLPLIIFAAGIVFHDYIKDRREATQRVLESVRSIRLTLDAEMRRMTGGLQVLSLTDALRSGDFVRFGSMASGFLEQYGKDGVILVADRDGQILYPRGEPDGVARRNNLAIVDKVFATGQPQYSNLFYGVVKKKLIITVDVPVIRDNKVHPPIVKTARANAMYGNPQ